MRKVFENANVDAVSEIIPCFGGASIVIPGTSKVGSACVGAEVYPGAEPPSDDADFVPLGSALRGPGVENITFYGDFVLRGRIRGSKPTDDITLIVND